MSQLARIFAGCCCAILKTTIQKQELAQEQAQKCPGWASQVDGLAVCEENAGLSSGGNLSLDLSFAGNQPWDRIHDVRFTPLIRF